MPFFYDVPQPAAFVGSIARRFSVYFTAICAVATCAADASAQVAINGTAVPCGYCTEAQMREAVVWRGPGTHYVADIPGSVLRRYTVSCGTGGHTQRVGDPAPTDSTSSGGGEEASSADSGIESLQSVCTGQPQVVPATVEQAALDQFYLVRQVWIDTGGTFVKSMDFPYVNTGLFWNPPPGPLGGPNAYNVVGDANFRAMLGTALANNTPVGVDYARSVATYLGAMINAFGGQTDGLRIVIRVVFPDGSSVVYDFRYGDASATYQPGSARTPVGQLIPDPDTANSPNGAGFWSELGPYGGQEDLERFLEYMRLRGVRIVRGEGTRTRSVRCDWDAASQTLTCTTT